MSMPNIFSREIADNVIQRINKLTPDTAKGWGSMNVSQMLAHCNVPYEMVFEDKHPKPNAFMRFILKKLVKDKVCGEAPYKRNTRTAPAFLIKDARDFEAEKKRLVEFINKTQDMGEAEFDNKSSNSFGPLTKIEWNNMFYKHLDHHLTQFGV